MASFLLVVLTFGWSPLGHQTPVPAMPPGVGRTVLLENDSVLVARLKFEPGAREEVHTHPFSALVMQLTAGQVEIAVGSEETDAPRPPGSTWFIARETPHASANTGGQAFEVVTVAFTKRAESAPAPAGATAPVPSGITRTPLVENDETRAARVAFTAGAREEVHSHPFDLLVVQLTPGRLEALVGEEKRVSEAAAGTVLFLPKDVPHAVANAGSTPFEVMSVAVKATAAPP